MILLSSTAGSIQLTKNIIVDATLIALNEYRLGDLTICRLARHSGTAVGVIYRHHPSKQALPGAAADRILVPCTEFSAIGGWCANIEAAAELLYSCPTAHRDDAEVVLAALATGTATIRPKQLFVDVLENAPETLVSTTPAVDTVSVFVCLVLSAIAGQQVAIALNLNHAKDISSKGDISVESAADKDVKVETSSEDVTTQAKGLDRQRVALGAEFLIVGISEVAGLTGIAGR